MKKQCLKISFILLCLAILLPGCSRDALLVNLNSEESTSIPNVPIEATINPTEGADNSSETPNDIPKTPTEEPTNPTESPTEKPENNATEPSTDLPETPTNGSDDNQESGDVPVYLTFASLEEIDEFIAAANGTKDEYDSYYRKLEFGERINQSTAKTLAKNITDNLFPVTSDKLIIEEFGATYYVEYQELNLYYQIDGLRYRFTYKFNYTKDLTHRTEPIVLTAKLGPYTFDMYQSGNWVGGFAKDGTTLISFAVFTKQPELVNASYFDLASRKDAPAVD